MTSSSRWSASTAFGDSNIDFVVLMQAVDRAASFAVRHETIKRVHTRFNKEGIEINYPVRRLVFPEQEQGEALHPQEGGDEQVLADDDPRPGGQGGALHP